MKNLVFHFSIAIIWVFLTQSYTAYNLFAGFAIGYALLALFQNALDATDYVRKFTAFLFFVVHFLWIFLKANWQVVQVILFKDRNKITSEFIEFAVYDLQPIEIAILSQCITLTPGTVIARHDVEKKMLLVHCLDPISKEATIAQIERELKRPILRFTR